MIAQQTGASVPKRQVEELTVRAARDHDAYYADWLSEPEPTNASLVLSFDDKGIALRHDDRDPALPDDCFHSRYRPGAV